VKLKDVIKDHREKERTDNNNHCSAAFKNKEREQKIKMHD